MTKIIRFKNGKCVKIECCGRCPAGSRNGLSDSIYYGRFTRCGFTAYVHDSNSLPSIPGCTACPLDDYDSPQTFLKDKVVQENSELRETIIQLNAHHELHEKDQISMIRSYRILKNTFVLILDTHSRKYISKNQKNWGNLNHPYLLIHLY